MMLRIIIIVITRNSNRYDIHRNHNNHRWTSVRLARVRSAWFATFRVCLLRLALIFFIAAFVALVLFFFRIDGFRFTSVYAQVLHSELRELRSSSEERDNDYVQMLQVTFITISIFRLVS